MAHHLVGDTEVTIVTDATALAEALADRIVERAASSIAERGSCAIALAGGSTPRAAYRLLAQPPRTTHIAWDRVRIFFGDERCVPPTHEDSNFRMASEALLDHVAIPRDAIHRLEGELPPSEAALRYEKTLVESLGAEPIFDLVLLGLGPDAHTASWFPDVVLDEQRLVDAPFVPIFQRHRLTLTPRAINAAREILVATAGVEKAPALAAVFGKERNLAHIPAQRLRPIDGTLTWLIDKAAAASIDGKAD